MTKSIAIIAGEPNSISSEIIFKTWKQKNKFIHKPFFIIGSINLLNKQKKKLKYNIKLEKINKYSNLQNFKKNSLPVYDINYNQKIAFEKINPKSNKYIFKCLDVAIKLSKKNKILGIINCPISKENLFKNKYIGVTEYLSKKFKCGGNEVMLLYNKKLSVSPLTTHIPLNMVSRKINKKNIVKKIQIINRFYKNKFKKAPVFGVLSLNPHGRPSKKNSIEKKIISPALNMLKRRKIKVIGPMPADSSFANIKKYRLDVIFGMYHDQVLTTFKTLFGYEAINITLGLPIIRTSPDHGIAVDIAGKKIANHKSLVEAIKFFSYIK